METAINSADIAEVTAMNTIKIAAAAPPVPIIATAAVGRTRPAETSAGSILFGYVGKTGLPSRASALRPIVVAARKGIANHARPPATYPGKAWTGLAAIALL